MHSAIIAGALATAIVGGGAALSGPETADGTTARLTTVTCMSSGSGYPATSEGTPNCAVEYEWYDVAERRAHRTGS